MAAHLINIAHAVACFVRMRPIEQPTMHCFHYAQVCAALPVQIVLVLTVLIWLLGWLPVAAGVAVMAAIVPLAVVVTLVLSKVRVRILECTDARVRLISEVPLPVSPAWLLSSRHMPGRACLAAACLILDNGMSCRLVL